MNKLTLVLAFLALGAFGLAACGDDEEDTTTPAQTTTEETTTAEETAPRGGGQAQTVMVTAAPDGSLAFQEDQLTADAGEVTFEFTNPAQLPHDFCLENQNGDQIECTETITDGSEDSITVDLEPGQYQFYCSVAGHREGGMEGPLRVR